MKPLHYVYPLYKTPFIHTFITIIYTNVHRIIHTCIRPNTPLNTPYTPYTPSNNLLNRYEDPTKKLAEARSEDDAEADKDEDEEIMDLL